jgi:serine/threonine protein kinase
MGATKTIPYGTLIDTIRVVKQIGSGGSANVYVGEDESNGEFYAVKSISHNKDDIKLKRATRLEAGLHARVRDHPHIIELERIIRSESSDWTHLIMEYGAQGDLYSAITEKDLYCGDHALIRNVFLQLIDAVIHCHENGVFHRDLKPDNIMVFDGGKTVKLADFGLATTDTSSSDYGCGSTIYFSPGKEAKIFK